MIRKISNTLNNAKQGQFGYEGWRYFYYYFFADTDFSFLYRIQFYLRGNRIVSENRKAHWNKIRCNGARLKKCKIMLKGEGNILVIEGSARAEAVNFEMNGWGGCVIDISAGVNIMKNGRISVADKNSKVNIGKDTNIHDSCTIVGMEGMEIDIGERNNISDNFECRVSDSHSILDDVTGKRINFAKDVTIGNDLWIGSNVTILKGVTVGDGSIIGTGTLLVNRSYDSHSLYVGRPAYKVRDGVHYCGQRI